MHEEYKTNPISVIRRLTTWASRYFILIHIYISSFVVYTENVRLLLLTLAHKRETQSMYENMRCFSPTLWASTSMFFLRVAFRNSTCTTTSNWLLCQKMHVSFISVWNVKVFSRESMLCVCECVCDGFAFTALFWRCLNLIDFVVYIL